MDIVGLESEKGKGTSFFVELTFRSSQKSLVVSEEKTADKITNKSSVLVFEDNIVNQNYIKKILQKENLEFEIASNGQEGFELAKNKTFDLIFMDISMPIMDGYEATIAIRNHSGPNQNTPIIALTASAMLNKKDKAFQLGMNDYMTKPFTPQGLKSMLVKYLNRGSETQDQSETTSSADASLLNRETLAMFYDGDDEYALEMFELFVRQYDEQIEVLRALLKSKTYDEAQKIVHKMKPTFSMVGAPEIQESFQLMEDKLRYNDQIGIENAWNNSEALLQTYIPVIHQELERLKSKV